MKFWCLDSRMGGLILYVADLFYLVKKNISWKRWQMLIHGGLISYRLWKSTSIFHLLNTITS